MADVVANHFVADVIATVIIHTHMISEYGKEKVRILWQWEKIELKMADFKNHRQFTLRCLSNNIIPVSV